MKRFTLILLALILVSTLSWAADGATLYGSKCAMCHGPQGQGKIGPSLQKTQLNAAQITDLLTKGDPAKKSPHNKPISGLSAGDAGNVSNYVATLKH